MFTARFFQLACTGLGLLSFACEFENPCQANDPDLVKKFGVPEQQTEGADGMCYTVDPAVKNWGAACDSLDLCGGGLICTAPDLPICTAIECNPDMTKDKVCGEGFMCIATGKETPTICIPLPPPTPSAEPQTSSETSSDTTGATAGDAGAADAATSEGETTESTTTEVAPNVGTACTSATDPVCVGGTFCEAQSLNYCTLPNCAEGLENAAACAAASGFCYSTAPAPATGICTVQ
jgi:hypothetical protein